MRDEATFRVKAGLAEMLKGGVIMDVVTPDQRPIGFHEAPCDNRTVTSDRTGSNG